MERYHRKYKRHSQLLPKIPSLGGLTIMQSYFELIGKSPEEIFQKFIDSKRELGSVFQLKLHAFDYGKVFISDPKLVEVLLSSSVNIDKPNDYRLLKPWIGNGLFLSTGSEWQQHRKIVMPLFHYRMLESYIDIMEQNGENIVENLRKLIGTEVEVTYFLSLSALDVIGESTMNCKINALNAKNSSYVNSVRK